MTELATSFNDKMILKMVPNSAPVVRAKEKL